MSARPNPLATVALTVGTAVTGLIGLVGAGVAFGLLSQEQAAAIAIAGTQLPDTILAVGGVVTLISTLIGGVVASFATAKVGAGQVTPISSPATEDPANPGQLVALLPAGPLEGHGAGL